MKWRYARNSHSEQAYLQYRKWRNRLTGKAWTVSRPALRLKPKMPCLLWARWKRSSCEYRHHPVCRCYKSGNRCICGYRCLCRQAWRWKETQRSCYSERKKKRARLCISRLRSNEFHSTAGHTWNSQNALGLKLNSGKKKGIWRHYPKRWTSWAKSFLARLVLRNNHLRKPHDKQIVPAK